MIRVEAELGRSRLVFWNGRRFESQACTDYPNEAGSEGFTAGEVSTSDLRLSLSREMHDYEDRSVPLRTSEVSSMGASPSGAEMIVKAQEMLEDQPREDEGRGSLSVNRSALQGKRPLMVVARSSVCRTINAIGLD